MRQYFAFLLLLVSIPAIGCSCISDAESYEEEFESYDAIFTSTAVKTRKVPGDWRTSFYKTEMNVLKVWKNKEVPKTVFVKTSTEISSCGGPPPTIGNKFLVFAHINADGLYVTGGCYTFLDLGEIQEELDTVSSEEREGWELMFEEMWSALGKPIKMFSE